MTTIPVEAGIPRSYRLPYGQSLGMRDDFYFVPTNLQSAGTKRNPKKRFRAYTQFTSTLEPRSNFESSIPFGSVMHFKLTQSEKAALPILLTLFGITTLVKFVFQEKYSKQE